MKHTLSLALLATTLLAMPALAQHEHHNHENHAHHAPVGLSIKGGGHDHDNHDQHADHNIYSAPIGVMGAHLHPKGEWMVSYRYMHMNMDGQRDGTDNLSASEIALNTPNPFGPGGNTRVVPTDMQTDMHMLGGMYGLTDNITLMAMGSYLDRRMDHITFAGGAGDTELGGFETQSRGIGDTHVGGLFGVYNDTVHSLHINAMLSLPTGSIDEEDDVLAPTGARPTLRLPYAMQLGSGTFDAMPGVTYNGHKNGWNWGAQYMANIRLESENPEGYSLGDRHMITAWGGTQLTDWLGGTLRLTAETLGDIDGQDPLIAAPVTTADPDNYGGDWISASVGFNITPPQALKKANIAGEFTLPLYQDLNGPQLERDYAFTLGLQYSF